MIFDPQVIYRFKAKKTALNRIDKPLYDSSPAIPKSRRRSQESRLLRKNQASPRSPILPKISPGLPISQWAATRRKQPPRASQITIPTTVKTLIIPSPSLLRRPFLQMIILPRKTPPRPKRYGKPSKPPSLYDPKPRAMSFSAPSFLDTIRQNNQIQKQESELSCF